MEVWRSGVVFWVRTLWSSCLENAELGQRARGGQEGEWDMTILSGVELLIHCPHPCSLLCVGNIIGINTDALWITCVEWAKTYQGSSANHATSSQSHSCHSMSHSLQHTVLPHNSATGLPASNSSENVLFLLNIDNNWLCSENVYYNCIEYIF